MERIHTDSAAQVRPMAAIDSPGVSERSFVEALVAPANVFQDPQEVVHHPWFTDQEKRTILLSWARDELVAEQIASKAAPELAPKTRMDAVLDALSEFDPEAAGEYLSAISSIRGGRGPGRRRPWATFAPLRGGRQ